MSLEPCLNLGLWRKLNPSRNLLNNFIPTESLTLKGFLLRRPN